MPSTSTDLSEVAVEKLVYGGEGLARLDGQVVLIPFVLPGEQVAVTAERVKTGLLRSSSFTVLEPSPKRILPRCEYFANCGGCHYQHAGYAFQLEQKRDILRETLRRTGGVAYEGEIPILSGPPWYYRNRIQLHFANGNAGFHKAASHEHCAIEHCEISSPVLNEVISKLQAAAKRPEWPTFLRSLEIFTNETEIQLNIADSTRPVAVRFFEWCSSFLPSLASGPIKYKAFGYTFCIGRGSFFQVNRFLIETLVSEVLSEATGAHVVDLYAGVGLFSLPLANRFERVDAVERSGPAYRDLEWNAAQNAGKVRATRSSAENFLRNLTGVPEMIVADPPRAGLGREATSELLRIQAPRLTLVSCDPSTLARDIRNLSPTYGIERLTLIDLFPQTYHLETVVHLVRN